MENAAQALKIAGAILIAIILLAILLMMYSKISDIPKEQEYKKLVEQIGEFNRQFEAYDKNLMYGVDVISCLNKVLDNNEKSEKYANGLYDITISITLKKAVSDNVVVYHINNRGKEATLFNTSINKTYKELFPTAKELEGISSLRLNEKVSTTSVSSSKLIAGTYNNNSNLAILKELSQSTVNMKLTATNPKKEEYSNWYRVEWNTASYDFKQKKFKCTEYKFGDDGRVNAISFVEQ